MAFLVLGAGYTGERVAARLLAAGETVHVTARDPARLAHLHGALPHRLDVADPASLEALAGVAGAQNEKCHARSLRH